MESQGELIGKIQGAAAGIAEIRKELQQLKNPTSDSVDHILERVTRPSSFASTPKISRDCLGVLLRD